MSTSSLQTAPYLNRLRELTTHYDVPLDIEAVADIQVWCHEHDVTEENPFRSAKALRNNQTGRFLILLADPITTAMVSSAVEAMSLRGHISRQEASRLTNPLEFLCHLFLHEVAHALDRQRSEQDCDRWALEQMEAGVAV